MKKYVLYLFILLNISCFSQDVKIRFQSGFLNDSVRVEAVYLGDIKITKQIFNKNVNTVGALKMSDNDCFEVSFDNHPRIFIKFYINGKFEGGIQVDKKSKNRIRQIEISNLFNGLVFNFS